MVWGWAMSSTAPPALARSSIFLLAGATCLVAMSCRAGTPAAMVAQRPGLMCVSADALARLTLPSGASRSAGPAASPRATALKQAGGCIDIPPAALVVVQAARRNTSVVSYDAHDGQGMRTFVVANIDFGPAAAEPAGSVSSVAGASESSAGARVATQAKVQVGRQERASVPPPAVATASGAPVPPTAAPAATAEADQPFSLPLVLNYASAAIALLHQTPTLAKDDSVARWWALNRFAQAYQQLQNQEFRLQPLLAQARADLAATIAATPPRTLQLVLGAALGDYDFGISAFPLQVGGSRITLQMTPCCVQSATLPGSFQVDVAGLDAIDTVPLPPDIAQAFAERHTRYGNVDRRIELLLTIGLDPPGIVRPPYGPATATGTLDGLEVLSRQGRAFELVYRFAGAKLAALHAAKVAKAEAVARQQREAQETAQAAMRQQQAAAQSAFRQRQLADRRAQLQAQRQQLVAQLSQQSGSVRLRNFISGGLYAGDAPLDSLREARMRALLSRGETTVAMLVQAGRESGGLTTARWPGLLSIEVAGPKRLAGGEWYLVSGQLRVPPGDDLPAAELQANAVFHCARAQCADAAEPDAVVDHMLATASP